MSAPVTIISVAFASAFGCIAGLVTCAWIWNLFQKPESEPTPRGDTPGDHGSDPVTDVKPLRDPPALPSAKETAPKKAACVVCRTTRGRIKAKGKCKKCYERERRAKERAKAASQR